MKMISKNIKNFFTKDSSTKLIGLLTIMMLLWLVLYLIPELFVSLFNTVLGSIILVVIVILVGLHDYKYGIILGISLIIIYRFLQLSILKKEGFTWSPETTTHFLQIQHSLNRNVIFDPIEMQKQASQEDLDYFLQNGMWYWSQEVIDLYSKMLGYNPYIRTYPQDAVIRARTIYNQNARLQIMSCENKEGEFLINGV